MTAVPRETKTCPWPDGCTEQVVSGYCRRHHKLYMRQWRAGQRLDKDELGVRLEALRAVLNEPGVRHLQPPNWRTRLDEALERIDRLT